LEWERREKEEGSDIHRFPPFLFLPSFLGGGSGGNTGRGRKKGGRREVALPLFIFPDLFLLSVKGGKACQRGGRGKGGKGEEGAFRLVAYFSCNSLVFTCRRRIIGGKGEEKGGGEREGTRRSISLA